ncbi:MAG: hypothetical protein EZS28_046724, partial [Streblomastix strix]
MLAVTQRGSSLVVDDANRSRVEVINWFTGQNPSVSSRNTLQQCQNTIISLIFDIPQITSTPSKLAYRAIAILRLSPKANNSIEQFEIKRTENPKICPNSSLFTWFNRLYLHYGKDNEHFVNLFWQSDGQPVEKRRISYGLNTLLREIGIRRKTAYSFKHAYTSELAREGLNFVRLCILRITEYSQKQQTTIMYMQRVQGSTVQHLNSQQISAKATLLKSSRNKDVEQLNEVIQVHCQNVIYNTLVIVRYYGVQLLNLLPSLLMRPYPSVEELNQPTTQEHEAIQFF